MHYFFSDNSKNTKDIFHWLELITDAFYKYSVQEKHPLSFCNISETLSEYQQKNDISDIFWSFKSKLQIIHAATYVALFLRDSNNCFFICLVPYVPICLNYFLILCFCFHLLFHSPLPRIHIQQVTLFDSISLQPARNIL